MKTDVEIEREIEALEASAAVKLARLEQRAKYQRQQRLYQLRWLEKRGQQLQAEGITGEILQERMRRERFAWEIGESYDDEI